jgi:hypothetical protein
MKKVVNHIVRDDNPAMPHRGLLLAGGAQGWRQDALCAMFVQSNGPGRRDAMQ